jgi:hypothetical protein
MTASGPISVTETVEQATERKTRAEHGVPPHWGDAKGSHFKNPWDSFRPLTASLQFGVCSQIRVFWTYL